MVVWPAYEAAQVTALRERTIGSHELDELRTASLARRLECERQNVKLRALGVRVD